MAKDAKLDEIEIKKDNFSTDLQEKCAQRLLDCWDEGLTEYTKIAERYGDASDSVYGSVMQKYMGPPDHDITVAGILAQYGSVKEYKQARLHGDVETDTREFSDEDLEIFMEGYRKGLAHSDK